MMAGKPFVFRFGDVEVREGEFSLTKAGEVLAVEPKAFRVLLYMLRSPQKLIPKEELLNAVWGDAAVTENSLTRSIALLRRLLGDDARSPRYIETVATVGYRWVCKIEAEEDSFAAPASDAAAAVNEAGAAGNGVRAATTGAAQESRREKGPRRRWVLAVGAVVVVSLTSVIWYLSRPLPLPKITAYTQITHDGRQKTLAGTDGSRLYFTQDSPNVVAQVGDNGGEIARLPIAIPGWTIALMDISPDGSNALIGAFGEGHQGNSQWVAPVLGGAAKRLEDGQGSVFSPDGGSVIYSTTAGDIYMVRTDGTGKHKLASVGSVAGSFCWSPDGKVIRFDKSGSIWEMSVDGSGIRQVLPNWRKEALQCCGRWTADGRFYLFLGAGGQIFAIDERRGLFRQASSLPIQLTNGPIHWDPPIPGKDGKTIFVGGATLRGELSRIDLKTASPQPFLGGISAEFVSFSPDGESVAYVAFPEGTLWKANRDGSNRMQLTRPPDYAFNPRWSSDSTEILFSTSSPDGHFSIHRVSALDGTLLWLMSEESANMHDASWSPDGTKVLFGRGGIVFGLETGGQDLRIVDLKSRQVTTVPGSEGRFSPRWSPDGRYITALFDAPPQAKLPIFDFTTQQWHTLPVTGDAEFPTFSHDSRFIYFLRYGRNQGVFRIPVTGGREERVVDMTDWHLTGNFGYSMSLDPTDTPLVLRDFGSDDIYALAVEEK